MILFFLKERHTGKDMVTYRFLLVFTSGSSLPSSELDPSLGSAERKSGSYGESYRAQRLWQATGKHHFQQAQLEIKENRFPLKMDLSPIAMLAGFS